MPSKFNDHYKSYKELYVVAFTFLLSGLFGSLLVHQLNESSRMKIKYENDLQNAREAGSLASKEVGAIISERHTESLNYIAAIDSLNNKQITPEEFEVARSKYLASKDGWNYNWNLMRVKIQNYFSDELALDFYDYEGDARAEKESPNNPDFWKPMSITGKFRALHAAIAEAKTAKTPETIERATQIYDSLSYDLYDFYDKMAFMLSTGNLGQVLHK